MKNLTRRSFFQKMGVGMLASGISLDNVKQPITTSPYKGKKLNIALCGLGYYATNLLAVGLAQSEFCQLAGIITGTASKAAIWKEKYSIPDKNIYDYNNFDSIKYNKDIDLVYVVLPNAMHKDFVIRAAKAGKHVITEKPMGINADECKEMIDACKLAGVQLAVGYRLHYEPFNLEIKRLGQQKVFGQVRLIEASLGFTGSNPAQWRLKKALSGGGPLMDVGIYCIQSCRYVLGEEPISVTAQFGPVTNPQLFSEVEESITWQLQFASGAVATSSSSYNCNIERFFASADKGFFELYKAFGYGPVSGRTSDGKIELPTINQQTAQFDGIGKLLIDNKPLPDHITGAEGLKDMVIIQAIYQAAASGERIYLDK